MKKFFNALFSGKMYRSLGTVEKGFYILFCLALYLGYKLAQYQYLGAETAMNYAAAELLTRYFTTEIQPLLYRNQSWMGRARDDDALIKYNTVELAHAGTLTSAQVNRTLLPAPIAPRTDTPSNYAMEEITVDPVLIGTSEELTVAYPKRQSVLEAQTEVILQKCGDRCIVKWAGGANAAHIIPTTGSTRPAGNTNGAQTGNRKAFTLKDLTSVQTLFYKDNVVNTLDPVQGVALITADQYNDLMNITAFNQYLNYGSAIIPEGVMKRAFGFDFYVRNLVADVDVSNVLKAEGAAGATTDQDAAIFWAPKYVRRALGPYTPFVNENKAEYYGSLFSALIRFGASPARNDNKGVVLVYESN